ncbi:MAG: hypothetical protein UHX00_13015 [Caryophanon sp.]|nr:hypothetical protein [Caryophanon sp.]
MKRLLIIPLLCLVGCSNTTESVSDEAVKIDYEDLSVDEIVDEKEQHVEDEPVPLTASERNLFNGAVDAINAFLQWDSYYAVSSTEHIVHTDPDKSYTYKQQLAYMKQPHETHLIYESENPAYMEIYANDTDGMYTNDSADEPNWTYTMDPDIIDMWQEEPLPDTVELLRLIVDESETFTVVDEGAQSVEFFLSVPSTTIDSMLDLGDSDPPFHMFLNLTLTMSFSERGVEEYTIVSDYVTLEEDEGQLIIKEEFAEVNNLANVRVPAHVKEQAVLDDSVIEWNE